MYNIEAYLPAGMGTQLRHTLWEWGIADDLTRGTENYLQIADPKAWRRLKKRHRREVKALSAKEENDIRAQLEIQNRIWKRLIFTGDVVWKPQDRRQVRWGAGILYTVDIISIRS